MKLGIMLLGERCSAEAEAPKVDRAFDARSERASVRQLWLCGPSSCCLTSSEGVRHLKGKVSAHTSGLTCRCSLYTCTQTVSPRNYTSFDDEIFLCIRLPQKLT